MFITPLTNLRHLSLSWASPIQSIYPHSTSWYSLLLLSTHLRLYLPSGLLPSGFPTKIVYIPSPRHTCHMLSPFHSSQFFTRTILFGVYKSVSSSLCSVLRSLVTSSFLSPNILLNTMFSNTLSFLSSYSCGNSMNQVPHYRRQMSYCVIYIFKNMFWKNKHTSTKTESEQHIQKLIL